MGKLWVVVKREYLERGQVEVVSRRDPSGPGADRSDFPVAGILISRSSASSEVRNIIILDASGAGLGNRVVRELVAPPATGRLGTDAASDTTGPRPDVRIISGAQLAQAESTATQEVMREGGRVGYLVLDDRTTAGMTARYAGRNATSLRDVERIRNAVSQSVMFNQLRQAGADPRMVDAIARTRVQMPTERITERGRGGSGQVGALLAIGIAFLFYLSIVMHGQNVLRGVLEEKMTRVAEVVISSVRPETLLAGKVLGVGAVGLTQQVIWVVTSAFLINKLGPVVMRMGGDSAQASTAGSIMQAFTGVSPKLLVLLLLFFLIGYIFYAAIHAAVGSMVNSEQEAQQAALPVMFLLIGTFIFVQPILLEPTGTLAVVMSWLPFSSPIIMPLRMSVVQIPTTTLVGSLLVGVVSCAAVVWLAGRIYRVGMLMYGKRPSVRELFRWVRYT